VLFHVVNLPLHQVPFCQHAIEHFHYGQPLKTLNFNMFFNNYFNSEATFFLVDERITKQLLVFIL